MKTRMQLRMRHKRHNQIIQQYIDWIRYIVKLLLTLLLVPALIMLMPALIFSMSILLWAVVWMVIASAILVFLGFLSMYVLSLWFK